MTLRERIAPRAERDPTDVRTYIVERNPAAAERLRRRIVQTIDLLADFPYIGRAAGKPGVLMTVVPRYRYSLLLRNW